ncbi:hypothetical protein, partial [Reichenbachiella sp. MALMAid0571]|uniref:hypothetical protein n=1 Tax=Reichenbachiella sp. MALMAid0571 TaxID=3143939 RepID=UPI0032DF3640
LNEMRKDFFDFLKLPPSPEGVIKKSPLGDLGLPTDQAGVILMNFLRRQNLFSDTNNSISRYLPELPKSRTVVNPLINHDFANFAPLRIL